MSILHESSRLTIAHPVAPSPGLMTNLVLWGCLCLVQIVFMEVLAAQSTELMTLSYTACTVLLFYMLFHVHKLSFFSLPVLYAFLFVLNMGMFNLWLFALDVNARAFDHPMESAYSWYYLPECAGAVTLTTLAISALAFGITLAAYRYSKVAEATPNSDRSRMVFILACVITIVCGAVVLGSGVLFSVTYSDYFELMNVSNSQIFFQCLSFLCPAFLLAAGSAERPREQRLLGLLFVVFVVPIFFSGWRGIPMIAILAVLAMIARQPQLAAKLKLYTTLLTVLLPVMLVASAFIGSLRDGQVSDITSPVEAAVKSLGSTGQQLGTVVYTMYLLEHGADYFYGDSYLQAIGKILPNIGLNDNSQGGIFPSMNAWVTSWVDPAAYARFAGISFSGVAEAYANFGLLGVFVVFTLIGIITYGVERSASRSRFSATFYGLVLYLLFFGTIKGELALITRNFVFFFGIYALGSWISGLSKPSLYSTSRSKPHQSSYRSD